MNRLLYTTTSIQVVVERQTLLLLAHPEEDMKAGRLKIGIDNSDPFTLLDDTTCQIGRQIGFAGATPVGVN